MIRTRPHHHTTGLQLRSLAAVAALALGACSAEAPVDDADPTSPDMMIRIQPDFGPSPNSDDGGGSGGDDGDSGGGGSSDMALDAGGDQGDAATPPSLMPCDQVAIADTTFAIDTTGPGGELSPRLAFDGQALWVTYTRPVDDTEGALQRVFLARLGCDGQLLWGPQPIGDLDDGPDHFADVTASGDRVHVVWAHNSRQDGAWTIRSRTLDRSADGSFALLEDTSKDVTPRDLEGDAVSPTVWELDATSMAEGRAAFVASYLSPQGSRVVLQRLSDDGARLSKSVHPQLPAEGGPSAHKTRGPREKRM